MGSVHVGSATVKSVNHDMPPYLSCSRGKSQSFLTPKNMPSVTGSWMNGASIMPPMLTSAFS